MDRLVVPYSQEYMQFRSRPQVLREIAERTRGRELTGATTDPSPYLGDREVKKSSAPIVDWLLIVLACMIPIDVGIRRVQLDMGVIRSWFAGRPDQPSEETYARLRSRKEAVVTASHSVRTESHASDEPLLKVDIAKLAKSQRVAPPLTESRGIEASNATSRLLAAKKRAGDRQERREN